MYIRQIFLVNPFLAVSLMICLFTILFLFRMQRRRPQHRADRILIGILGMFSVYEGLRILQEAGILKLGRNAAFDDTMELIVATCYLIAALMLKLSSVNHLDAESAMRLVRAAPPRVSHSGESAPLDISRHKDASTLETLNWAIPRLSDGAFKLYAFLCLRVDHGTGRIALGVVDVRLQLGKSKEELDALLEELGQAGAVAVRQDGASANIEIVARNRQTGIVVAEEMPRAAVAFAAPRA